MLHKLLFLLFPTLAVLFAVWFVVLKHKLYLLPQFMAFGLQLPRLPRLLGYAPDAFFASWQGYAIFAALASLTAVLTRALVRAARAGNVARAGDVEINHVVPFQPNTQK